MSDERFLSRTICIRFGGFIAWIFKGFEGKLEDIYIEEKENKHFWIGYLTGMLLLVLLILPSFL